MKVRIASKLPKREVEAPKAEKIEVKEAVKNEEAKSTNWREAAEALSKEFVQNEKI